MSKLLLLPILALVAVLVAAPASGAPTDRSTGIPDSESQLAPRPGPAGEIPGPMKGVQTDEEALAQDMALEAQSRGWTVDQVAAHHEGAEIAGRVAAEIREQRPDTFVGLVLSSEPAGPAELYIRGPADEFVHGLVDKASIQFKIVDNQPFSQKQLDAQVSQVTDALWAQGYRDSAVWYDLSGGGTIEAEVTRQPGLPDDPAEISSTLPSDIRNTVRLTVIDDPVGVLQSASGGMQLRDDGVNECTSGWSVWKESAGTDQGRTGVTGAGHCSGINEIVEPGVDVWALTFKGEHRGAWGDVEWYTSTEIEPGQFYADASNIRRVTAVEAAGDIYVGQTVCFYG